MSCTRLQGSSNRRSGSLVAHCDSTVYIARTRRWTSPALDGEAMAFISGLHARSVGWKAATTLVPSPYDRLCRVEQALKGRWLAEELSSGRCQLVADCWQWAWMRRSLLVMPGIP